MSYSIIISEVMKLYETDELINNLMIEMKRGTVVLSVLSQLKDPVYGYSLVQTLQEKGFSVDAGTLYPLMRRLESQGLLLSEWETSGAKPRKYYKLSENGHKVYGILTDEWYKMTKQIDGLIEGGKNV